MSKKSEKEKSLHRALISKMLDLSTSAMGLVAALAWNDLIKDLIDVYIKPIFGASSGMITKLIYAMLVTVLAVGITYNLSRILGKEK